MLLEIWRVLIALVDRSFFRPMRSSCRGVFAALQRTPGFIRSGLPLRKQREYSAVTFLLNKEAGYVSNVQSFDGPRKSEIILDVGAQSRATVWH